MEPILIRPTEAAARLSVSRSVIYELIHLPAPDGLKDMTLTIGKSKRIILAELEKWIEQKHQEVQGTGPSWGSRDSEAARLDSKAANASRGENAHGSTVSKPISSPK